MYFTVYNLWEACMTRFLGIIIFLNIAITGLFSQDAISYLNTIRQKTGLIPLEEDTRLSKAELDHCKYMDHLGILTHYEEPGNQFFSGRRPDQRAVNAGMHCRYVFENISFNQGQDMESIDALLASVYHRFSLLNTTVNIAGYASYGKYFGMLLANSFVDSLCRFFSNSPDLISFVYVSVCDLYQKKLPLLDFVYAVEQVEKKNAGIVVYPYPGQQEVPVGFSGEEPNPVPGCYIAGFPVTVEFNSYYFPIAPDNVVIKLRDQRGKVVQGRLLTAGNDPQHNLSLKQFAFIPRSVLRPGELYHVELRYKINGVRMRKVWSFETVDFPNVFILNGRKVLYVPSPSEFYVMIDPRSCRDSVFKKLQVKYSAELFNVRFVDDIFLKVDIKGREDQYAEIDFANGYSLRLVILGE